MADQNRFGAIAPRAFAAPAPARDAPRKVAGAPAEVSRAIADAARRTGVDFGYLLQTARKESALDPSAKARTSSATGLFQFIDQTWLGVLKEAGASHGYAGAADAIRGTPGRYTVDPNAREAVLSLRRDPAAAAAMAAELTRRNAAQLTQALARSPTRGELYIAHVMGPSGAARLIGLSEATPAASAADAFPRAAAANRAIFYAKGQPRSAAEVVAMLSRGLEGVPDDGSGEILKARAQARTWWDFMGGSAGGLPTSSKGAERPVSGSAVASVLPRPRLDAAQAAHAYGQIRALSR